MPAPLIGITTNVMDEESDNPRLYLNQSYVHAVVKAGGIPVLVPSQLPEAAAVELFDRLDALLFTGGADIEPSLFNGLPHAEVYGIDNDRDRLEIALVRRAVDEKKPFLGICRGIQVINVALGGTLFTHIADQAETPLKHDYYPGYPRDHRAHPVSVEDGSRLGQIVRSSALRVNSLHHQGLKDLGAGLRPTAFAPDHLIEAVELDGDHPFALGVQWHPEAIPDDPQMQALFRALVEATSKKN